MDKRTVSVFLIVVLFGVFFIPMYIGTEAQAAEVSDLSIGSVNIVGNTKVTDEEVLAKVRSRPGSMFASGTAEEDCKRIAQLAGVEYAYYNTAVIQGRIDLTFVVIEKNVVRAIVFVGNKAFKSDVLGKKLDFELGDFLDPLKAKAGATAIADYYREKGYPYAKVAIDSARLSEGKVIYRIEEGPRVKIAEINFVGNRQIETKELQKLVKTKEKKFMAIATYYIPENMEKDVNKLQSAYYERGFLNSKVTSKLNFSEDKKEVKITFDIFEGAAYKVNSIALAGNTHFEEKQLREGLQLETGQVFNQRKAQRDEKELLKNYKEAGFIEAKVESKRLFVGEDKVNLEYTIEEGSRFSIGKINITGNKDTKDKVVRHVLDEYDFKPGNWYNADTACGDGTGYLEKLIRNMTVAKDATVTASGQLPDVRDAQVNITEGQTGMILLGAGVASDSGVIGQLVYEQRNFDFRDKPKSLWEMFTGKAYKGAGQTFRIAIEPGTEVSQYSVSFTEPYFKEKPISLDLSASSYQRGFEAHDEERLRGYVGFEKRYKNKWRRSISFRGENVDVASLDYDAPREIRDEKGKSNIFGIRLGIGKDMRDDFYNPSKGYSFSAGYEQVAGDHTFGIIDVVYRRYKTLHEDLAENKTVLSVKLLGAANIGNAPFFEKFYGGGTGAHGIRGFEYRGISPRGVPYDPCTATYTGEKKDPIGSDWIFIANAEVTIPLGNESISALFFVDSGMVDEGGYRASVGTGLQILIPQWFGPVPMRFELAMPFMKDGDDDTQVFSFSVGRLF
ncbi:MAG: outer membrane protein assembly factor BamA [Sedimentisphaerales bacterium]|nr:outer membrane protein assembly factor BamA [Sedimentisphaerales bacterium]